MRPISSLRILCALSVSAFCFPFLSSPQQPELKIAAAADLKFAMTDLAAAYEKQSGVKLNLTFGSSGNFYTQIQNGAPFDIFFSADSDYPRKLNEAGLVLPNSADTYAIGKLVVWSPASEKIDPSKSNWQSLLDPSVKKIAIANPDHAPYGRAALEALKNSGLYEKIKDKLVFGDNIAQTAQFVQSGNAQIGILAESLILAPSFGPGHCWKIPPEQYTPLIQSVVALKSSRRKGRRPGLPRLDQNPSRPGYFRKIRFHEISAGRASHPAIESRSRPCKNCFSLSNSPSSSP